MSSLILSPRSCTHSPQCHLRPPNPPDPNTQQPQYYVQPPTNIRLLPREVFSYEEFLSLRVRHSCEECDEGSLFENYSEVVEYPEPGPCGGTSGSPVTTCPNSPNSCITLTNTKSAQKIYKKREFKCDKCNEMFIQLANLCFHTKRKHELKI